MAGHRLAVAVAVAVAAIGRSGGASWLWRGGNGGAKVHAADLGAEGGCGGRIANPAGSRVVCFGAALIAAFGAVETRGGVARRTTARRREEDWVLFHLRFVMFDVFRELALHLACVRDAPATPDDEAVAE